MHALMRIGVFGDEPYSTETARARCANYAAPTAAIPTSRPTPIPPT
jgi:hypothetical protein